MHQNILALIYYASGLVTGGITILSAQEIWHKSLGVTILFYFLWHTYEQILRYNNRDKN